MASAGSILGNAVQRLEDPTLLTGEGKYVDDLVETGMLYVAFVRSAVAHGDLESVDTCDAESMPGVLAVYHSRGDDLGPGAVPGFAMMPETFNRPVFATDKVRFVGDIVAAVVAETQAQANDAAETVLVEYEALPAIIHAPDGMKEDAPLLFPENGSNICFASQFPEGGRRRPVRGCRRGRRGRDGQPATGGCSDGEQRDRRRCPDGEGITMWVSHQAPHSACTRATRRCSGIEPDKLRVVCPWVGGGFGPKAAAYVEHIVAAGACPSSGSRSSGSRPGPRTWCRWCKAGTTS